MLPENAKMERKTAERDGAKEEIIGRQIDKHEEETRDVREGNIGWSQRRDQPVVCTI